MFTLAQATLAQAAVETNWKPYLVPIVAAVIVAAVLAVGWRDVTRFRLRRVRAIAGVCFAESIRRRVLWVIPLAIVGVVAVSQLTRPLDALDAVRQTTKYCIFATGLIVVVAG
jgi:Na+/H+ antiporter NhaC